MTQNIYDTPDFFAAYAQLDRSVQGLAGAPEWPALQAMLPPMAGMRVLDLGCGYGWFCRWAQAQAAALVVGIDVSQNMLRRAQELDDAGTVAMAHPIRYLRADLEQLDLPSLHLQDGSFDLVYSSLTLHYLVDLRGLIVQAHRALAPGGRLVFSAEHPMVTAPSRQGWIARPDDTPGGNTQARKAWPVDGYLAEGPRTTDWLAPGVVKQHRTLATYVTLLLDAGFSLAHVDEWGPSAEQVQAHPDWAHERERPAFLLVGARRA